MAEEHGLEAVSGPGGNLSESALAISLAESFGVPPQSIINVIKNQIIAVGKGDPSPTGAECAVVLSIMNKYQLDPFVRQVSAWRDNRGKLCVAVEMNGWTAFARRQPGFMRVSFKYGEMRNSPDGKGKPCWEWVQTTVHDSEMGDMEAPPVFLDEWYVPQKNYPGNWQDYTKHRLSMKSYTSAIRMAYGFGVYDDVDREIMSSPGSKGAVASEATTKALDGLSNAMRVHEDIPDEDMDGAMLQEQVDEMEAMAMEAPPEDDFIPCASPHCGKDGTKKCKTCKIIYCADHFGTGLFCKVCGG